MAKTTFLGHCTKEGNPLKLVSKIGTEVQVGFNWSPTYQTDLNTTYEILKSVHRLLESSQGADQGSSCFSPSGDTCEAAQQEDCYLYGVVR